MSGCKQKRSREARMVIMGLYPVRLAMHTLHQSCGITCACNSLSAKVAGLGCSRQSQGTCSLQLGMSMG